MSAHRHVWSLSLAFALLCGAPASVAAQSAIAPSQVVRGPAWDTPVVAVAATRGPADTRPVVDVQFDILREAATSGGLIDLPLGADLTVRAAVRWAQADAEGMLMAGPLVDSHEGEVSLTVVRDTLVGRLVVDGRLFMIRRAAGSTAHIVTEIDQAAMPPESAPRVPILSQARSADAFPVGDTNAFVDLMVLFTPAARLALGGTGAAVAEASGAVDAANLALANANVTHRFRLVHAGEIAYTETDDPYVSLDRLTNTLDGYMDDALTLRNMSRADVVTLMSTDDGGGGTCGVGWLMGPSVSPSFESAAYNVVNWNCALGNLTLAHEIGHNMGLHHDLANAGGGTPAFPFAYGYAVPGVSRDVMAYNCSPSCPRRQIYSTPLYPFPITGGPAGTASADSARALNGTSLTVANFRQAACSYGLSATSALVGPLGGAAIVGVSVASGCSWTVVNHSPSFVTLTSAPGGSGNGTVSYSVSPNAAGARSGSLTIAGQLFVVSQTAHEASPGDFDGDRKSDVSVFRPSNGTWYVRQSSGGSTGYQWGNGSDLPVPGDYDGDGRQDVAVFRPSNGTWYMLYVGTGTTSGYQWGSGGDTPLPGDYDGDGKTDLAVFRPSNGTWYIRYTGTGATAGVQWGNGQDVPLPADYDGDGRTDVAVFRPSNGTWYVRFSLTGATTAFQWGNGLDVPVPGDYDGDGRADYAVFRPSNGTWYIRYSSTGALAGVQWGNGIDVPTPGDYDGDRKTDVAVFRPSNGTWYIIQSSTSAAVGIQWGNGNDIPILER